MAKRLSDSEKKELLETMMEVGRKNPSIFFARLASQFPQFSSTTYSTWTKKLFGKTASEWFTDGGAVMTDEQQIEYVANIMDTLKKRYIGKEIETDIESLKADNTDVDFSAIEIVLSKTLTDEYEKSCHSPESLHSFPLESFLVDIGLIKHVSAKEYIKTVFAVTDNASSILGKIHKERERIIQERKELLEWKESTKDDKFAIWKGKLKTYRGTDRELIIPEGVEIIEKSFSNDMHLRKVVMPDTVTYGGYQTFCGCKNLNDVHLSSNLSVITRGMFSGTSIFSIDIPESVKEINESAFDGCKALRKVVIHSSKTKVGILTFYNCPLVTVYCPNEMVEQLEHILNVPCLPLDALITEQKLYYEDENFFPGFATDEKTIEEQTTYTLQIGKETYNIVLSPADFGAKYHNKKFYSFEETRKNYISYEEALEEYEKEDPNYRSDGFAFVKPYINAKTACCLNDREIKERVDFLRRVLYWLNDLDILTKLAEAFPKKTSGKFITNSIYRIACAGIVDARLNIPAIVAKASDEHTLEVYLDQTRYSVEEEANMAAGFLQKIMEQQKSGSRTCDANSEDGDKDLHDSRNAQIILDGITLPVSVVIKNEGTIALKTNPERPIEDYPYISCIDTNTFELRTENREVQNYWREVFALYEYFESKQKSLENYKRFIEHSNIPDFQAPTKDFLDAIPDHKWIVDKFVSTVLNYLEGITDELSLYYFSIRCRG